MNLGHTQRGGTPTAYDRMLATRYGVAAIDLVHEGRFGRLVVLKGTQISDIPLADAIAKTRTVAGSDRGDEKPSAQRQSCLAIGYQLFGGQHLGKSRAEEFG